MQTLQIGVGRGLVLRRGPLAGTGPAEYVVPPDVFSLRMAFHTGGDTPGLHNPNGTKVVQTWRSAAYGDVAVECDFQAG